MPAWKPQNKTKQSIFKLEINVPIVVAVLGVLVLGYLGYQDNLENSQKINALLTKYEKTLDAAIANDGRSLAAYRKNVEKALNQLSPQEKALLESAINLSKPTNTN